MKWKILYEIFSSVKAFFDFFSNLTWAEENFHPEKKSERWEDYGRVGWLRLQDLFLMGIIGFEKREG